MNIYENNRSSDVSGFRAMAIEEKILSRSAVFRTPEGRSPQEALVLFRSRIEERSQYVTGKAPLMRSMIFRISSVAAALLVILGLWFFFQQTGSRRIMAARGTHLEHQLPDGSQIALNAGSRIRYDQNNFGSERKVNLDGEAFFSVVKGRKFVVSTRNGNVTVIGTSFNVYSRDNEFIVTCVTGKVKVTSDDATIVINPGESSRLADGKLVSSTVNNTESTTGWIKGEFTYDNSPLNQVLGEIERQFNIKFVGGNFDSRYFTGTFTNKDLKNTLDIVCIPMGLTYAVGDKGKILIQEKTRQ